MPGELEHASGEVDEFEAALVAGADGEPEDSVADEPLAVVEGRPVEHPDELDAEEFDELEDEVEEAAETGRAPAETSAARRSAAAAPGAPTRTGPGRFIGFLLASWAELQRVQWPDRRQVAQATAVVIGFVIVAGLYLGLADKVAQQVVDFIL